MTPRAEDDQLDVLLGQLREALGLAVEVDRMRNMQLNMAGVLSRTIEALRLLQTKLAQHEATLEAYARMPLLCDCGHCRELRARDTGPRT